jgi:leucine dehydrogenase
VAVQGAGSVGRALIKLLREAGAEVTFTDVNAETIRYHRDELGLRFVPPDSIHDVACDVFAPCALGGALNVETIPRLKCRAIAGAANNQLASPDDAARLRARDILYAPDYVINAGGAIAIYGIETLGWSHDEAMQRVSRLGATLRGIYDEAAREGITTDAAARRIAEKKLNLS